MALYSMEFDTMASLLSEEPSSLWAAGQVDFLKDEGSSDFGGSTGNLADDLLEEISGQHSEGDSLSEELPEWMSEKISLTQWIDAADIMPSDLLTTVPLSIPKGASIEPAEELLQTLMVDDRIPPQPPSPGEQQAPDLLALSPAGCLYSPESPMSPSSPSSSMEPPSPKADPPSAEKQLWQIAEGLTTIFLPEIDQSELLSPQSGPESSPASPQSSAEEEEERKSRQCTLRKKARAKPKLRTVNDPVIKKSKKRDQNKVAATRYRQKKRLEADVLMKEQLELDGKNKELKDKVESLTREIKYLQDLMAEVYKVKGELKILQK
ncbi:activating transcription factor of chaperone-like [Acanthaster planci]|uniref:Activating transcription factor of chaperone-like n=1 Tax=Acanthaster planci TaxID=133434 RepID=A0A8B7YK86_ACAPL|nr:activating transcription factor of chaperone-like [Acanthaster planci]